MVIYMIENKLISLAGYIGRASVKLAFVFVRLRDKFALRKLNYNMHKSDWMAKQSRRLAEESEMLAENANAEYDRTSARIKAQYTYLRSINPK